MRKEVASDSIDNIGCNLNHFLIQKLYFATNFISTETLTDLRQTRSEMNYKYRLMFIVVI